MSTAAVSVSPAENSAASSATCRRWTAATPFSAHYALTACPLRFAHAMILYHRSSQTASALFSIFSGCMYFLECSPNTCSDSVFLFSHVYVSLARPWFRWALTIQAQKTLSCYLAAQKAAGTPVQVAYHLATPEVYATDPVDFDNTAGPLTIMTGGEVEVRMTELVGSRSPELTAKMDKATYDADGDGVVDEAAAAPWSGITGKPSTFAPSTHNHDDRYYTESEMNTKLNGKANSSHTHTKDQVGLSKVNNNAIGMGYDGNLWISFS